LQSVSDQELEGAVKADVRQSGFLGALALELRRAKTQKAIARGNSKYSTGAAFALEEV